MSFEFKLPEIGEGIKEGEVVRWLVKRGDRVAEDQPIVEVLTDKATVEISSPKSGKIAQLLVKEGEMVKVGKGLVTIEGNGSGKTEFQTTRTPGVSPPPSSTLLASPATRKLAREMGVDLRSIRGSGPQGRITQKDLEKTSPVPNVTAPVPTISKGGEERIPLRGIRKRIAEHMVLSKRTVADFTHVDEVDMTEVVSLRESLKSKAEARGVKLTYLPFVVRAVSLALDPFSRLNSSLDEDKGEIVVKRYVNIGFAVNNRENDLVVPVIKGADQKSILQIAAEISSLTEKAQTNQLTPSDLTGGTFTITSIGNIGGLFATPIVNYPEVAILGFYRITDQPVVRNGQIVIRKMAHLSVTIDHRVVDGAMAASFVEAVKRNLEDPKLLFNLLDA
ncbi:MAG: dihydrolipoamide acetyltransferase family protein [Pseudomonadota bacterium]